MKKILVAISLMLVASFLIAIPAMGAISTDDNDPKVTLEELLDSGILGEKDIHYVGKPATTAPVQDGVIKDGEYSYSYRDANGVNTVNGWTSAAVTNEFTKAISEYVDVYFSYDEEYVYIAISDPGFYFDEVRHNTAPNLYPTVGINHSDISVGYGPQITLGKNNKTATKTVFSTKTNNYYTGQYTTTSPEESSAVLIDDAGVKEIDKVYVAKTALADGGASYVQEYKYNKADVVKLLNYLGKSDVTNFPSTFFFTLSVSQYMGTDVREDGQPISYVRTVGRALTGSEKLALATDNTWWLPAVVVLGEAPSAEVETDEVTTEEATTEEVTTEEVTTEEATTEEVTTEEATTEEVTTEEATTDEVTTEEATTDEVTTDEVTTDEVTTDEVTTDEVATDDVTEEPATEEPATEAPATEEPAPNKKKGCKGSVGMMGIALVATLGTCAVVVAKKKED